MRSSYICLIVYSWYGCVLHNKMWWIFLRKSMVLKSVHDALLTLQHCAREVMSIQFWYAERKDLRCAEHPVLVLYRTAIRVRHDSLLREKKIFGYPVDGDTPPPGFVQQGNGEPRAELAEFRGEGGTDGEPDAFGFSQLLSEARWYCVGDMASNSYFRCVEKGMLGGTM